MGRRPDVALSIRCGKAEMRFGILGPLEVGDGEGPVRVPGAKERALLADLLVHAGRVVAADRLVEDLWGEQPPGNPANTLQGRVSALRRALGPAGSGLLLTRPPGYALAVGPEAVDAARFERLVAEAEAAPAGEAPRAARQLEEALGLWRGPALAEFADQPWAQAEAARLEELRLAATEALVELRLAGGGHAGLVGELEGLVAAHPTRERLRGQLMLALYRSGRQADALGAYLQAREVLAEELGIDPSPELQRLHHQILVQDPALEAAAPGRDQPRHNLPERLTSLVGREGELRDVAKLVAEHRLVTVTGPGGAGKTSVAVALAGRLADGYPDGAWLVALAPLRDPAQLPQAVAVAVGLAEEAAGPDAPARSTAERLAAHAADKGILLVLDNCEHLVEACAALARRLLEAGPRLRVLATSREVLGVPGEVVWPIPPLAVPAPADDAGPGAAAGSAQAAGEAAGEAADGASDAVQRESHGEGEGLEPVPEGGRGGARGGAARGVELVEVALDGRAGVVGDGEAQQGAGEPRGRGGGAHRALSDAGSSPCHMRSAACRASRRARAPSASSVTQRRPLPPRSGVGSLIHAETSPFSSSRRRVT